MDRRHVLATVGSIGMSGCLRLVGSTGSETATPDVSPTPKASTASQTPTESPEPIVTETETPTETETQTATPRPSYPLGLSDSGIANGEFLFATHIETLRESSAKIQWTKARDAGADIKWKKEYKIDGVNARGNWTRVNGGSVDIYRNPLGDLWQEDLGSRLTYGEDTETNGGHEPGFWGIEIVPLLNAGAWGQPKRINEGRPAIWEIKTDSVDSKSAIPGYHDGQITSIGEAVIRIDERGIIRSGSALYQIQESDAPEGNEINYESKYQVNAINKTTVEKPNWISSAREKVPSATAAFTDDQKFVQFEIKSGNRLEENTVIYLNDADDNQFDVLTSQLDKPLSRGTTAYLFKPQESSRRGELGISQDSPPTDASPETLTSTYDIGSRRRDTHYYPNRVEV